MALPGTIQDREYDKFVETSGSTTVRVTPLSSTVSVTQLFASRTTAGFSSTVEPVGSLHTFQMTGRVTSGSGSATLQVHVSNDNSTWLTLGTIALDLTDNTAGDGFSSDAPWKYLRAHLTAISGTGANVNFYMGQ